jgi:hypothetical protein
MSSNTLIFKQPRQGFLTEFEVKAYGNHGTISRDHLLVKQRGHRHPCTVRRLRVETN